MGVNFERKIKQLLYCYTFLERQHLSVTCRTMNTSHLTSPDSSVNNFNDVIPSTLTVNQKDALLVESDVNVGKERATSVLPILDVPDSPGVNVNGTMSKYSFFLNTLFSSVYYSVP